MKTSRLGERGHIVLAEGALSSVHQPGVDASEVPDDLLPAATPQFARNTHLLLRLLPHPTDLAHIPLGYVAGRFGLPLLLQRGLD